MKKIDIFFSRMFPPIILKNEIVASIIYVITKKLSYTKDRLDETMNTDI